MYELNSPFTGDMSPMYTRYDLELLYRYRDSINVLISGSSRPWAGIDPTFLNESFAQVKSRCSLVRFGHFVYALFQFTELLEQYFPSVARVRL